MKSPSLPLIALTLGDPSGIGPELVAKLLQRTELTARARVVIVGDRWVWDEACRGVGRPCPLEQIAAFAEAGPVPTLLKFDSATVGAITPGSATAAGGRSALAGLQQCIAAASRGEIDGLCFAPLNKLAMKLAGLPFADELHYFARELNVSSFVTEFNVLDRMWTSRVTSHIPLREVADAIEPSRIKAAARLLHRSMTEAGVARPRLAVAGLNPHAGEGGTCGREEIDVIAPTVAALQAEGLEIQGPLPADTVFLKVRRGDFDAIVTMYHDQGQIALKLLGFDRGVTVQGGLPVVITTPAHGTAFDIVGQNRADVGAMVQAFQLAVTMGASRIAPAQHPLSS
jgi:4-hydroxythreonine-4-phosphate dehydrogenase